MRYAPLRSRLECAVAAVVPRTELYLEYPHLLIVCTYTPTSLYERASLRTSLCAAARETCAALVVLIVFPTEAWMTSDPTAAWIDSQAQGIDDWHAGATAAVLAGAYEYAARAYPWRASLCPVPTWDAGPGPLADALEPALPAPVGDVGAVNADVTAYLGHPPTSRLECYEAVFTLVSARRKHSTATAALFDALFDAMLVPEAPTPLTTWLRDQSVPIDAWYEDATRLLVREACARVIFRRTWKDAPAMERRALASATSLHCLHATTCARQLVDGILPAAPLDLYEAGCRDALARGGRAPRSRLECYEAVHEIVHRGLPHEPRTRRLFDHLFWDVPRRAA